MQQIGQLAEARVHKVAVAAVGDHQAHLVALQSARLRRLVRLERGREGEGGSAHAGAGTSSAAR